MSAKLAFKEETKKHLKTLEQYVPVVARVHGGNHPEFHEVHKLFDEISKKTKEAKSEKPELNEEFAKLREITGNYTVPAMYAKALKPCTRCWKWWMKHIKANRNEAERFAEIYP